MRDGRADSKAAAPVGVLLSVVGSPQRLACVRDDLAKEVVLNVDQPLGHLHGAVNDVLSPGRGLAARWQRLVDGVDEALPALPHGERPSRRREIVDAAMDMADRLVKTQYEFLRSVVQSAGTALSREEDEK